MIYLDTISFEDKETLHFFSHGDTSDIPYFSHEPNVTQYYQKISDFQFRDIININSLCRPGSFEILEEYIKRRQQNYINTQHTAILNETCGLIIYRQQIEKLIKTHSDFTDSKAELFRKAFGKKNSNEIEYFSKEFQKSVKQIKGEKEIEIFLNTLNDAAEHMFDYDYALKKSKEIYLHAYFKVHHPETYAVNLSDISSRIAIFSEYNIDIKNDYITFKKQMVERFGEFYEKQSLLVIERAVNLIKEGLSETALEQGKFAYSLSQYQEESYHTIYILFILAQLCIDTDKFAMAKKYCDIIREKLDPKESDYNEDNAQLMFMYEIIKTEGWKEDLDD